MSKKMLQVPIAPDKYLKLKVYALKQDKTLGSIIEGFIDQIKDKEK